MEYWSIQTVPIDEKGMLLRPGVNGGMYKKDMAGAIPVSYVAVEDIDRALKEAKMLGAKVVSDKAEIPTIGKFAIVLDPEGNPIGIMQPADDVEHQIFACNILNSSFIERNNYEARILYELRREDCRIRAQSRVPEHGALGVARLQPERRQCD